VQLEQLIRPAEPHQRLAHCLPVSAADGDHLALAVTDQFHLAVEAVAVQVDTAHAQVVQVYKATTAEQHQQISLTVQAVVVVVQVQLVAMAQEA
jgi:hypothetical protein